MPVPALNVEYVTLPTIDGRSVESIAGHIAASIAIHRNIQAWMKELNRSEDLALADSALSDYFYSVYRWLDLSLSKLREAIVEMSSEDLNRRLQAINETQSEVRLILAISPRAVRLAKQQIAEGRGMSLQELRDDLEARRRT
jgi:hypothetical protein